MSERRDRGLGARLRAFWNGPLWWIVPLALLVGPVLFMLLRARLGEGGAPFVYTSF